jgi:signal transduction histidine kinase
MLERLEKSFVQQQRFIADASHELRTPITVICGYADMLEKYGAEDKEIFEEATAEIKKSVQNMQYLVENLLFLARADSGTQPLKKSPVELNEILKIVIENFENPRLEFIDDKTFETAGDSEFLKKMFSAFIDNALIYSNEKVFVKLKNNGDTAVVEISDKGIGIAPENLDNIFDRFFRVDKSRVKLDEDKISAGLGLTIAKWIADNHGVKIEVASELGKGSTFKLTFHN